MHATAVGCRREYARSTWRTAWDGCQVTFSPRDRRRHPREGLQPFLRGNHSARTLLNQRVPVRSASQPSGAISRLPNPLLSLSFSYRLGTPAPRHPRRVEALGSHSVILHQRRGSRVSNREPPTLVTTILFKSIPSFRTVHIRTISAAYTASSHTHIKPTMAIRARAKAFFRRSRNANDDTLSKTDSTDSHERWPSNVYKPGEPMPRPKYRAPPKKEHKEHLDSFSFGNAWRRKSFQSQYSPMGTRAPSRLPSAAPSRRSSWYSRKKSMSYGRSGSVTSVDSQRSTGAVKRELSQKSKREIERKPSQRSGHIMSREPSQRSDRRIPNHNTTHAAIATRLSTEIEQEGDDDVFNGECLLSCFSTANVSLTTSSRHVTRAISRALPAFSPSFNDREPTRRLSRRAS
jgi:hypothetical protein